MRRTITPRSLAIIGASGLLCAALVYAGHRSFLIALFGGVATIALVTVALWPGEGSRNRLPRRRGSGETMNRRITPSSVDVIPSDLRVGEQQTIENVQRDRQDSAVRAFLRIVRDATGYDEVVFWRSESVGAPLAPITWSSDFTDPREFREPGRASIDWAAESRLTVTDGKEPPDLVAGPVGSGTLLRGVLSFTRPARVTYSATDAKKWLDRSASHLALLVELLEIRNEFQRQGRHSQALLQAAYKIQAASSTESLGPAICETALEVTSATRAALIHWDSDLLEGRVESVSAGHPVPIGFKVIAASLVGQMCTRGLPLVKENLRPRGSVGHVYADDEPMRELGSLGIVPLKNLDDDVIGAVVIEGELPGDVVSAEVRNVSLLATVASTSLQITWKMEETSRRARTDQLTGLFNRRHFEEQLQRVLAETDRFGGSASLLLADLDYFKRVNDTHGHDAGDAVLRYAASLFMETIRTVDVCARYGGEELAILLPQTNPGGAMELAERLRHALESRPVRFGRAEIAVTSSFGVASYPDTAPLRDGLFPAADKALYRAKADGRNCVRAAPVTSGRRAT